MPMNYPAPKIYDRPIVVSGATGKQGGAVVQRLLRPVDRCVTEYALGRFPGLQHEDRAQNFVPQRQVGESLAQPIQPDIRL